MRGLAGRGQLTQYHSCSSPKSVKCGSGITKGISAVKMLVFLAVNRKAGRWFDSLAQNLQ